MKKSRFTETQIVGILKEAEGGIAIAEVLRTHGVVFPVKRTVLKQNFLNVAGSLWVATSPMPDVGVLRYKP